MPRHSFRWFIVLLLVILAGGFVWYKMRPEKIEVTVAQATLGTVEKIVANTRAGTLKACRKANLSPAIGGQISVLTVDEGDKVRTGQLLLELWNNDLKAEAALAEQEITAAKAKADASLLQAEIARREAERMQKLIADTAISEQDADKIITEAKVRQAAYEAASTEVAASRARLGVVTAHLERTMLKAPFDGIIAKINGELNEYVTPSPQGIPTPPTIELLDTSCFYVIAPIDEVDAPAVQVDMEARVLMDAFADKHFPARVRRIDPYVLDLEKQARTVDVEVEFLDNEDGEEFLAGYSADVEIIIALEKNVLRIPTQALLDNNLVFVYQSQDQRLQEKNVQTGLSNWDFTQVIKGLREGDSVVVSTDRPGLKDGVRVKIFPGKMIRLQQIERIFQVGEEEVHALRDVDFSATAGDYIAIMGPSGSGKSTLLNIIGLLDRPDGGTYELDNIMTTTLDDKQQADVRRHKIGFVFQFFHLVPRLTAEQNVELPLVLAGVDRKERNSRVRETLTAFGLGDRGRHRPDQLSGGQRQRVAIARATIMKPSVILADEPTGNLDRASGSDVVEILEELNHRGMTLIMVTHDPELGDRAKRRIKMVDGRIVDDTGVQT